MNYNAFYKHRLAQVFTLTVPNNAPACPALSGAFEAVGQNCPKFMYSFFVMFKGSRMLIGTYDRLDEGCRSVMADDQPTIGSWAISSLEEGMEKKEHAFLMETWREYKEGIRQREGQPPQPRPLAEIQYYENTAPELLPLKEFLRSEIKLVGFLNAKTPFAKLMNSFICNHRGLWNVLHGDAVRVQPPDEQLPVGGLVGGPGPNPASGVGFACCLSIPSS